MATGRPSRLALAAACLAAAAAGAADLGTLFTTPEERARLDRLRRGDASAGEVASTPSRANAPVVTGYVKRSDGRNTVWIDGEPVSVGRDGAALLDPRAVDRPVSPDGALEIRPRPSR